VDWIDLAAQDREMWTVLNAIIYPTIPENGVNFLDLKRYRILRRAVLYGVNCLVTFVT
jgi:hypothetical protein